MLGLGMTAEQLLDEARRRTLLRDFGAEEFLLPFRMMVASVNEEADFSTEGQQLARERFLRLLVNRLRVQADIAQHPEILEQVILPPAVIVSLPRTGSTKLHRLLWQGGDFLGMMMWQGYNVAPFPGSAAGAEDPRIADAARFLSWRESRHAGIRAAHNAEAQLLEEEVYLVEYSFTYWSPFGYYPMASYVKWVREADHDHVYAYLRVLLQYLQWQHHRNAPPRTWILKTPPHFGRERDLVRHFPGAKVIALHRDLREAVPSLISLACAMRHQYTADPPDKRVMAAWAMEEVRDMVDRHIGWRDAQAPGTVLDLGYADVLDHELDVARRVYAFCGLELRPAAAAAMAEWSAHNSQHAHGEHKYDLSGTDITEQDIVARFRDYSTRFAPYMQRPHAAV
jgi:Sulfotransferase family